MGKRLRFYKRNMPGMMAYHVIMIIVLFVVLRLFKVLSMLLIRSTGRVAITTGDFTFLFTTWQGWLLIVLGLAVMVVSISLDLNSKVAYASHTLKGEKKRWRTSLKEGFISVRKLISPLGILLILYVGLLSPLLGGAVTTSLTGDMYIPNFISSVIFSNTFFTIALIAVAIISLILSVIFAFVFQGMMIDGLSVKDALKKSKQIVFANWKNYLKEILIYFAIYIMFVAIMVVLSAVVILIISLFVSDEGARRALLGFFVTASGAVLYLIYFMWMPGLILCLTRLYYKYTDRDSETDTFANNEKPKKAYGIVLASVILLISVSMSAVFYFFFDDLFPPENSTEIIAHRAGGNDGTENTVSGIEVAIEEGAMGAEIDIQRTSDGYYVVNHDTTFERVAGDSRKPSEMTLEEVKKLKVFGKDDVATLEDMLMASKGRIILYIELKGETADEKMVDETVATVREMGMEDEVYLISLKYDLIKYTEEKYPDIKTAFLAFVAIGDAETLKCDALGLEEEAANDDIIMWLKFEGKEAIVWTPNDEMDQRNFLLSDANAIITDNIAQAMEVKAELMKRSDTDKIIDSVMAIFQW